MNFHPTIYLFLLIIPSGFYFTENSSWWVLTVLLQATLLCIGLFIRHLRLVSGLLFLLLLFSHFTWITGMSDKIPLCKYPEEIETTAAGYMSETQKALRLIKIKIYCKDRVYYFSTGVLTLKNKPDQKQWWIQPGTQYSIVGAIPTITSAGEVNLRLAPRYRLINRTRLNSQILKPALYYQLQAKLSYYLGSFPLKLVRSLIFGDKSIFSPPQKENFQALGISHLFAISGLHIGILFLWISVLIRLPTSLPVTFVQRGSGILTSEIVALSILFGYLLLIGFPVTAVRAWSMLLCWVGIKHFFSWQPLWNILLLIAIIILLISPTAIGQISFQLSFLSVAGILLVLPFLPESNFQDPLLKKLLKSILSGVIITAWLIFYTLPIVTTYFYTISPTALLNNLIHIFYLGWIFIPLAILTLFVSVTNIYFWEGGWEFYFFAVFNVAGRVWEEILRWNLVVSKLFIFQVKINWSTWELVTYWGVLSFLPFFFRHRGKPET